MKSGHETTEDFEAFLSQAGLKPATHGLGIRCSNQLTTFVVSSLFRGCASVLTRPQDAWYAFSRFKSVCSDSYI